MRFENVMMISRDTIEKFARNIHIKMSANRFLDVKIDK